MNKYEDKYEIKMEVCERTVKDPTDFHAFTYANITIEELYGLGGLVFKIPLKIRVFLGDKGEDRETALAGYDFGLDDEIPIKKEHNWLYNYNNDNPECDPVKTVFAAIKFDLMHAFFHYSGDPNYTHLHWALYGNLSDHVDSFEWDEHGNPETPIVPRMEEWKTGLNRYDDNKGDDQKWGKITKIVVPTEEDKNQFILACKHIHDSYIDTDYMMVNTIAHLYNAPELVVVEEQKQP